MTPERQVLELQNCNSLLNNHQQENIGSHKKKKRYPTAKAKEKPQRDRRWDEIAFRIKPIPVRDARRAQTKSCGHQDPETPQTEPDLPPECLSVSCRDMGQQLQQTRVMEHVTQALLEEVTISPTIKPLSRRPRNCRKIIPKKLLHCQESSRTHNRVPNLGI